MNLTFEGVEVFKFGGASVKNAEALRNVRHIIQIFADKKLLIVVSAMGKTTNLLEEIISAWFENDAEKQAKSIENLHSYHTEIIAQLDINDAQRTDLQQSTQAWWHKLAQILAQRPQASYNLHYDQIICFGELVATHIVSEYLNMCGEKNQWLDARNYIITDQNHRNAKVNWTATQQATTPVRSLLQTQNAVIQGFVARAADSILTTTLGREGSDFTASILAHCLDAQQVTIWKDVAGVLTADPKLFDFATKINELTYNEAVALTYYGASVIHPKTVHPLQRKNIPLCVKSFINPREEGTIIHQNAAENTPKIPCVVLKKHQILLYFITKDLSFIEEEQLAIIYQYLNKYSIRAHLTQDTSKYFALCTDDDTFKITPFVADLQVYFDIKTEKNLELLNIRHFDIKIIEKITADHHILIEHRSRTTAQFVLKKS
jgi:aspartate kinase